MKKNVIFNQLKRLSILTALACAFIMNSAFTPVADKKPLDADAIKTLRYDISHYAQNFVGIHYHYAGVAPRTGFDCSGFTHYILKEFDVKVSAGSSTQATQGIKIALEDVQPGDLVFFARKNRVSHVAMVVDRSQEGITVVHSTNSRGVVVENISTSKYWKNKILYARDVISTANF